MGEKFGDLGRHEEIRWRAQFEDGVATPPGEEMFEFTPGDGDPTRYEGASAEARLGYGQVDHAHPDEPEALLDIFDYEQAAMADGEKSMLADALKRFQNAATQEEKQAAFTEIKQLRALEKTFNGIKPS